MTPETILHQVFHLQAFRSLQKQIVESVLAGQDVLAVLPTGTGKSLCFQIPALCLKGTTLVISPLVSLMKDQVDKLTQLGISATFINSSLTPTEKHHRLELTQAGNYSLLYLAPESLLSEALFPILKNVPIPLIVLDEAHCVSMWGHDFRPEYLQLESFISALSKPPILLALTATATAETQTEIMQSLQRPSMKRVVSSFRRPNLCLRVKKVSSSAEQMIYLLRILKRHLGQTGIIYTLTRQTAGEVAEILQSYGYQALAYHGGLSAQDRTRIQDQFISGQTPIIAATNAFGMGVDKPNIRFVIHYQPSLSLENYYQEIGRAGRDGQPSDTYYLFLDSDERIAQSLLSRQNSETSRFHQLKWQKMRRYVNQQTCRQQQLLEYFGEFGTPACGQCDVCCPVAWNMPESEKLRYQQLELLRDKVAAQFGLQPFQVLPNQAIEIAAIQCPHKPRDLLALPGLGHGWLEQWGSAFETYCKSQT